MYPENPFSVDRTPPCGGLMVLFWRGADDGIQAHGLSRVLRVSSPAD